MRFCIVFLLTLSAFVTPIVAMAAETTSNNSSAHLCKEWAKGKALPETFVSNTGQSSKKSDKTLESGNGS